MDGQHRVGGLIAVPGILRDLGVDPAPVIARGGLSPTALCDPENAISFVQLGALLQACVAATGCPHFGLLVAERTSSAAFGLVGQLMRSAPTLKDAILDLCTNQQRYIRGAVAYLNVQDGTAFWGYAVHLPGIAAIEQIGDGAVGMGFNMVREFVGVAPEGVLLSRYAPEDAGAYRRYFGCAPRFDSEQNAVAFPARLLAAPVRTADPVLRQTLLKAIASYWTLKEPSVADRVIRELRGRIVFLDTALEDVADRLEMHPRTLNRRLQAEGTSFRTLLNRARFEAAQQWLRGTRMEITNIALALGYADLSGFSHAFQRWAGTSPLEWRMKNSDPGRIFRDSGGNPRSTAYGASAAIANSPVIRKPD